MPVLTGVVIYGGVHTWPGQLLPHSRSDYQGGGEHNGHLLLTVSGHPPKTLTSPMGTRDRLLPQEALHPASQEDWARSGLCNQGERPDSIAHLPW